MLEKTRGMTPKEIVAEVLLRAGRKIKHAAGRAFDRPNTGYVSDAELRRALANHTPAEVAARIRAGEGPRLTPGLADLARTVAAIKRLFPDSVDGACREGEAILNHNIIIFGRAYDLGPEIAWHADPTTGARWPLEHYTRIRLKPAEGANVRAVWELNRLHHFTTLGRAYLLTGDERFSEEFLSQLHHWNRENPPRFGVNWTVAMEAAIRAVNIITALEMFRASPLLTDDAIASILKILLAHGRFIRANLEFSHRSLSNHYLSDLIGLSVIGHALPELCESQAWAEFGTSGLLTEMFTQVLWDGVNYENSTAYHRLVVEIFLTFFTANRTRGIQWPMDRLEAMF
ncbi:MAG TPA: heparinase II/III family protein, partial [Blastocatellia bacterium]|nr:heparinase II/III family protein [Blastocatellia bacterium]